MTYQVNEIFTSVQGEGIFAGSPATFIRLQGCPVGCVWCDTKYTWKKGGTRMSVAEILASVDQTHVVITGGEPTLYDLDELLRPLLEFGCFIQLETSGLHELKGILKPSWLTWSPKPNLRWSAPDEIWQRAGEVKWVVDEALELPIVMSAWTRFVDLARTKRRPQLPYFVFMPEGCPPTNDAAARAMEFLKHAPQGSMHPTQWRYGDRLQWRIGVK